MRQGTRTFVKAAFASVLGVLSVPLAGFTEAQAQVPVDQPFPAYNPYPPGILPADLQPELLRVRREVQTIFGRYFAEWQALTPPTPTGNPPTLQGTGYEAVRILGGSRLTAITRVVAPLLKKSLAGAWLLVFIPATRELSTAIFLVGANTRVIAVMLLDLSEDGNFETLSALGFFLLVSTILIVLAGYKLIGRDVLLKRA